MIIYSILAAKEFTTGDITVTGSLNKKLFDEANKYLSQGHQVITKDISEGYDPQEEHKNLQKADVVIIQFPIYWFNVPCYLKQYMDTVFQSSVLCKNITEFSEYGTGGLLRGKYMMSVTLNAPHESLLTSPLFGGNSIDTILKPSHLTYRYLGLKPLPTYATYNVYSIYYASGEKLPELSIDDTIDNYKKHIGKYIGQ